MRSSLSQFFTCRFRPMRRQRSEWASHAIAILEPG
jgi:hypothetical protein